MSVRDVWGPGGEHAINFNPDPGPSIWDVRGQLVKEQRANDIWSTFKNGLANFNAGSGAGPGPTISAGPVWNPQQIQAQVNASKGTTDAQTATNQRLASAQAAGHGFGAESPLVQALQSQQAAQGMATKAESARQIPWDAAQGNAKQLLAGQTARESQFASRQQEEINRKALWTHLLASLGGSL